MTDAPCYACGTVPGRSRRSIEHPCVCAWCATARFSPARRCAHCGQRFRRSGLAPFCSDRCRNAEEAKLDEERRERDEEQKREFRALDARRARAECLSPRELREADEDDRERAYREQP